MREHRTRNTKRITSFIIAATAAFSLCGCGNGGSSADVSSAQTSITKVTGETQPSVTTTAPAVLPDDEPKQITTAAEKLISPQVAEYVEFSLSVEGQDGEYSGAVMESVSEEASNGTYLSGFADKKTDNWSYTAQLPAAQYYNIVLVVIAGPDSIKENSLMIDGKQFDTFKTDGSGRFEAVGFENVWLDEGECKIGIGVIDGSIGFDYMMITASDTVASLDVGFAEPPQLSNKDSDSRTKAIYSYLSEVYGKNMLSGQYETVSTNAETEAIYKLTGHYPAIRFGDLVSYTEKDTYADDVDTAVKWAQDGGLVGYVWHWSDPLGDGGYYISGEESVPKELTTDFDITKAVTQLDIAEIPLKDLETMCSEDGITPECLAIVRDIDVISDQLALLRDRGVTVLWRPLNEASGGWFWWGKDKDSYIWLWKLMYARMTRLHGLNNLIWIWNGQHPDWYVGDEYCDIISADIYDDDDASQLGAFLSLRRISGGKPLALSECGRAPDVQKLADEKTVWSFFGIWSGEYVIDGYGEYSDKFISKQQMTDLYSNSLVICRDELPDFEKIALENEKAQQDNSDVPTEETQENIE